MKKHVVDREHHSLRDHYKDMVSACKSTTSANSGIYAGAIKANYPLLMEKYPPEPEVNCTDDYQDPEFKTKFEGYASHV